MEEEAESITTVLGPTLPLPIPSTRESAERERRSDARGKKRRAASTKEIIDRVVDSVGVVYSAYYTKILANSVHRYLYIGIFMVIAFVAPVLQNRVESSEWARYPIRRNFIKQMWLLVTRFSTIIAVSLLIHPRDEADLINYTAFVEQAFVLFLVFAVFYTVNEEAESAESSDLDEGLGARPAYELEHDLHFHKRVFADYLRPERVTISRSSNKRE